ncbi:AB hydrolase-1 domain-containing protein [Citrus sinensis]|nr:AB hydrolase-1 domain-containing protein [Citrus sinensis]
MATIPASCIFSADLSAIYRRDKTSSFGERRRNPVLKRVAVTTEQTSSNSGTAVTTSGRSFVQEKAQRSSEAEAETSLRRVNVEGDWEESRKSLKDYFDEAKDMIRSDGGPPRWFSPLECGAHSPDSPLLLYLPGIDGVGLGLIMQHQRVGQIFDVWCLHIPVKDRTSFTGLVKLVERTVRSENYRLPNRPIYLVGESLGACLALAVAAQNPDIDLVLILANPATSFSKSQLQPLIPLLQLTPDQVLLAFPYMLRLMQGLLSAPQTSFSGFFSCIFSEVVVDNSQMKNSGDPLRMAVDILVKGLPLQHEAGEVSQDLVVMSSYHSVVADIMPKETLLWKLEMLKSASAYANSRLHAVKAQMLIISRCSHFGMVYLVPEDDIDLVTIIKGTSFYRRGKYHDYVSDFIPPTPDEFRKIYESNRGICVATGPVMLSTLEDGKIVRGLAGIPSEGPVLFVGYHMLLGLELTPLVCQFMIERNILLRGIAHPLMFVRLRDGLLPDLATFDTHRIMGAVPVSGTNFYKLLSSKSHVLLYPGGMREALHRKLHMSMSQSYLSRVILFEHGEEYKLLWPDHSEFVRMAARFGAKIIPFGAVGEDDIGQVVFDYDDLMKIPYFKAQIEALTGETIKLRTDANGEIQNQDIHLPGILPKLPGRFYYYFGKPIETEVKWSKSTIVFGTCGDQLGDESSLVTTPFRTVHVSCLIGGACGLTESLSVGPTDQISVKE